MTATKRFAVRGPLAIDPKAVTAEYPTTLSTVESMTHGAVVVVGIVGPLAQRPDGFFASYPEIVERVREALASKPSTLVLSIDSPGGCVAGCFEAADEIRSMLDASGVPSIAYVDGAACSAGYALAVVCDSIAVPSTGIVGSIGVMDTIVSVKAADAAMGADVRVITSGPRKADGHPSIAITDEAEAECQRHVDYLAGLFAQHVAERRGIAVEEIQALGAGIEIGANALIRKLADEVISFSELLARLVGHETPDSETNMSELETILEMLKAIAAGESPDAETAKRMIAAAAEPAKSDEPAATKVDVSDSPEAKAIAAITAAMESDKRDALIAARPDLSPAMASALRGAPVAMVEKMLAAMPKRGVPAPITTVAPASPAPAPSAQASAMALAMGTAGSRLGTKREGNRIVMGVPVAAAKEGK